MAQTTIIWTFLPNGVDKGKLRFSAVPSFRLPEEGGKSPSLALFPEILNWTDTLKTIAFGAEVEKGPALQATRTSPDPDPELWKAIFQPDAPVIPFRFADLSRQPVIAYPARHIQTFIAQQYITTAVDSPEEPPTVQKMLGPQALGQIRMKPVTKAGLEPLTVQKTEPVLRAQVSKTIEARKVKAMPVALNPDPPQDFYLLRLFHQPRNKVVMDPVTKRPVVTRVPLKPPEIDFHQAVALITQYPALMRLLGLAIDFEAPVPAAMPRAGNVRIVPGARQDSTPWTHFVYEAPRNAFAPAAKAAQPEVVDGFLDLADDEQYDIVEIDLDGAALKTAELSDEAETKSSGELPSLRSGGLAVVRTGNAEVIATALVAAAGNNVLLESRRPITLYAEDLVQGYRIDVWDDRSKAWHSLCQRKGTYRFTRLDREVELEDEGYVSSDVTQAADDSSQDIYAQESLFCWEGWSLVAPRPGKAIDPEDNVQEIQNSAATAFRLETKFKPSPGSLPRLRFGVGYRLRARAVDLAGNSLDVSVADDTKAIPSPPDPPRVYTRFDPIRPPVLVLREATKRGESLDDIVIRNFNDEEPKDAVATTEEAERHVAPPKTAQLNAEIHGEFDTGVGLNPDAYALICAKDPGAFKDIEPDATVPLPYLPDPWAKGVTVRGLPHQAAGARPMQIEFTGDWPEKQLLRLRVVEGEGEPSWDPASRVLTISLKKAEKATLRLSSYLNEDKLPIQGLYRWLEKPEIAIPPRLMGIQRAPAAERARGMERVQTMEARAAGTQTQAQAAQTGQLSAQAAQAKVKAAPAQKTIQAQSAIQLIQLPKVNITAIRPIAAQGLMWMMTPFRDVTVVHAVQQPIGRPAKTKFVALKHLGDTFATLDANLTVHGWSTTKIDLLADWQEPLDNVREAAWRMITGSAHVLEHTIEREATSLVMNPNMNYRHEFGDTKYREVTYHVVATSRYREQMPEEIAGDADKITRTSDPIVVPVLNSARPAMPKILYIVPTFGWERNRDANRLTSARKGGGLRVYMERPWFSSGDGELLAAVLLSSYAQPAGKRFEGRVATAGRAAGTEGGTGTATTAQATGGITGAVTGAQIQAKPKVQVQQQSRVAQVQQKAIPLALLAPPIPDNLRPFVTQWGIDPLWRSGDLATAEYPLPDDFEAAVDVLPNLTVSEVPGVPRFTAVGHAVKFDEERGLWYCDIEVTPKDAYFPFLRMSLARFQPNSIEGAHLSRLVLADFIQLVPNRSLSIVFDKAGPAAKSLNVTVSGVSYIQGAAEGGPADIEVTLETRSSETAGDFGWTVVPNGTVALRGQRVGGLEPGHFTWAGKVNLPTTKGAKPYRLVVREYEKFVSDEVERPGRATITAAAVPKKVGRLAYAEIVEL
jgi:hypothetical protein